jgi:hypothetical protein
MSRPKREIKATFAGHGNVEFYFYPGAVTVSPRQSDLPF